MYVFRGVCHPQALIARSKMYSATIDKREYLSGGCTTRTVGLRRWTAWEQGASPVCVASHISIVSFVETSYGVYTLGAHPIRLSKRFENVGDWPFETFLFDTEIDPMEQKTEIEGPSTPPETLNNMPQLLIPTANEPLLGCRGSVLNCCHTDSRSPRC
jgi:hypothetical protein